MSELNMASTIEPKSDQQNYDDYISGPRTVTVSAVKKVGGDQPIELHLAEFPGRPFKPNKSMRRVLAVCWGNDGNAYVGRRLTLFGDPTVKWAGQEVGGIRIAALSHITEPLEVKLTVTRGKRQPFIVQPLDPPKDESGRDWLLELADTDGDVDAINALGQAAKTAHAAGPILATIRAAYKDAKTAGVDR